MNIDIHQSRILILDFGSQYSQLIARRVRELGVYCELISADCQPEAIQAFNPRGIILSGGPESLTREESPRIPSMIFSLGCPVLGICYGMQAMALQLGGQVHNAKKREYGYAQVRVENARDLLPQGQPLLDVWMSHGDYVTALPAGFASIASTDNSPYAGIADFERRFFGLQFHPEVTHTQQGKRILAHFVLDICGCQPTWNAANIITDSIEHVRALVKQEPVLVGLSGGVDSSVVAALLHQAIGAQLTCVFVDTGLLRLNEGDEVMGLFAEHLGVKVIRVNAQDRFMRVLTGVADPEKKAQDCRRRIYSRVRRAGAAIVRNTVAGAGDHLS